MKFSSPLIRSFSYSFLFALAATVLSASSPQSSKQKEDAFTETPTQEWLENFPESKILLPAPAPKSVQVIIKPTTKTTKATKNGSPQLSVSSSNWTFLGPAPIPNGQTIGRSDPVSGRITAIAVHPTNPNLVYIGAAQGGVYRTTDGGATWVQLMDTASAPSVGTPLAIGSITIDPTDSTRVFVGTGEGNLAIDSFFGSGFYIITGAGGPSPVVTGPLNAASGSDPAGGVPAGTDVFTGRSIVAIAVDPTNANNIFVTTSSGQGGIRPTTYSVLPRRGLFRSTNALSASPTWTRLQVGGTSTNTIATSVVMEPGNPNNLAVAMFGQAGADPNGVYITTNALAATPTFTRTLNTAALATNIKLAIQKDTSVMPNVVTVYATTAENAPTASSQGKLYKSVDGGMTWTNLAGVNGFAGGQGFYDISVGVDATNANNVSVGGQAGSRTFQRSTDGGATFTIDTTGTTITVGLHADVHAITYAPSNGNTIYHGNDGGIWRSTDGGNNWTSLNNGVSATQFSGIALHPTDRNFTLAGSQDNGTELERPDGTFFRVDFGDGGYSLIDQNAPDTTNVVLYHTYFNQQNNLIGSARNLTVPCATEGQWSFHGIYGGAVDPTVYCDGTSDTFNGISITNNVQFYAPMALGPGSPNTWYFGTDRLYRSIDKADTAAAITGFLGDFVNDVAISPQDDNVRLLGTNGSDGTGFGSVWATTNGGTMVKIAGFAATNGPSNLPAGPVQRVIVDPNNKYVAYAAFGGFGTPASPRSHVWRVSNLDQLNTNAAVAFTAASSGLPDVPVNSIAIDPQSGSATNDSTDIYVGTDIGVYKSSNAGATWTLYGTGFPRCASFGLGIQSPNRVIRAATHGRGMYEAGVLATPPQSPVLLAAYSRLTHGAAGMFDVDMPLAGGGVECRRGTSVPGNFTIVLRFTNTLAASQPGAVLTYTPGGGGTGNVLSSSVSGMDLIVQLTNVSDVQTGTLAVSGVIDSNAMTMAGTVSIPLGFNIGDTNGDKTVNSADIGQTKAQSGNVVTASNFREDVNIDGVLNSADIGLVKSKSGSSIP